VGSVLTFTSAMAVAPVLPLISLIASSRSGIKGGLGLLCPGPLIFQSLLGEKGIVWCLSSSSSNVVISAKIGDRKCPCRICTTDPVEKS
jgi:hypothetical protein